MSKKALMKQTVVLCPGASLVGHLFPMMELAKCFAKHGYDVAMAFVELPPPFNSDAAEVERVIATAAATNPCISFHVLPSGASISSSDPCVVMLQLLRQCNDGLESLLRSIVPPRRLHSLVIDVLNGDAIDVAAKLSVPVYTFFPSGAAALAVLTQFPALCAGKKQTAGLKDLGDTPLEFLGVPSIQASHLTTEALLHPEDERHKAMVHISKRVMDTRGVIVNTAESLERRAVQALTDMDPDRRLCVLGRVLPPVYCVGPLVAKSRRNEATRSRGPPLECLGWLDLQAERSVVFLCFGSLGSLSEEQLREIAVGLEESGQRFLWVIPAAAGRNLDLGALLPEGFLTRTSGRGIVVMSWAPQVDVLRHPATGAFVTHCGWNSTLEALMAGVPMLCWPLYGEQKMNKVFMTTSSDQGGMGVGVAMDGYQVGFVKAEEVAAKLRLVMESDKGRELRARVAAHRKEAEAALEEGGSSSAAFRRFLSDTQTYYLGGDQ